MSKYAPSEQKLDEYEREIKYYHRRRFQIMKEISRSSCPYEKAKLTKDLTKWDHEERRIGWVLEKNGRSVPTVADAL